MKVKSAVRRLCKYCNLVRRKNIIKVTCIKNPRHAQKQGFHTLNSDFLIGENHNCTCHFILEEKQNIKSKLEIDIENSMNKLI